MFQRVDFQKEKRKTNKQRKTSSVFRLYPGLGLGWSKCETLCWVQHLKKCQNILSNWNK